MKPERERRRKRHVTSSESSSSELFCSSISSPIKVKSSRCKSGRSGSTANKGGTETRKQARPHWKTDKSSSSSSSSQFTPLRSSSKSRKSSRKKKQNSNHSRSRSSSPGLSYLLQDKERHDKKKVKNEAAALLAPYGFKKNRIGEGNV
jgi:hypothetical protein